MSRNVALDLFDKTGPRDGHEAARLYEPGQITQIVIIGAEVRESVDRHDGVKEVCREGQSASVCVDGIYVSRDIGISNSLQIFRRAEPQIGGPYRYIVFTRQEYR